MKCKYPRTLVSVGRGAAGRENTTLACDTLIAPMGQTELDEGESPLKIYRKGSGVRLNFAKSSDNGDHEGGSGVIEVSKLADVRIRTMIAMQHIMDSELQGKADDSSDLLSVQINYLPSNMQNGRKKTAAEIATMYNYDDVMAASALLQAQADKGGSYAAANAKQAQALAIAALSNLAKTTVVQGKSVKEHYKSSPKEALNLARSLNTADPAVNVFQKVFRCMKEHPELQSAFLSDSAAHTENYVIYDAPMKTPSNKRVDRDGLAKAYSLKITASPQRNPQPFHIELITWKGHPSDRTVGLRDEAPGTRRTFVFDLTTAEWNNMVEEAIEEKRALRILAHNNAYKQMLKAEEQNIAESKMLATTSY